MKKSKSESRSDKKKEKRRLLDKTQIFRAKRMKSRT